MSTSGRRGESEFGNKYQDTKTAHESLTNGKSEKGSSGQKMTKSSSVSSFNSMSDPKGSVMDQDDILKLTQDVKHFSDGLSHLKTVFSEPAGSPEDLRVLCHSKLGEVLAILKNILNSYPALQSTEIFAASGTLISKIKSYNYGGPKDAESERSLFESIDQLALAFSSSVSDYLMGDMDTSGVEEEKVDKTKSYDNLSSPPSARAKTVETQNSEESTILTPDDIDGILSKLQAGVDLALQRAKAWSKYMKDIASYIERKTHLEAEYSKSIHRLAQTMRPVLTEEGFLPLQSVYCTVLSQDIEYSSTCQATQVLLQTQKFIEPLTNRRIEHDRARKNIKDSWVKECRKMNDAVHSLRKAQALYNTRKQEYEKARELASKTESEMLSQSSSAASSKVDKRKRLEEDAMHKAAEAETTYKACVAEANSRQQELAGVKSDLLAKVREQILLCDQVIRTVTVDYFQLLQTVTAPIPVQYHTLCETSKQYVPGVQYGEFVRRLSLTATNMPATAEPFVFEPYISASSSSSSRDMENRKTSTQSTGSSSEMHSQDDSPQLASKKDRYRVKAWSQGLGTYSDTDSASGSSKSLESSPSNSPHPTGRHSLVKTGSLDDLEEPDGEVTSRLLQLPATDGVDLQGIFQRHGRRRNTTFGVDFQEQVQHCKSAVPPIITKCLKEVEKRGMTMKGIYRVSGVKSKVEGLCAKFEKNPEQVDLSDEHPNVISNVLKLYLRQLPEPLFTFKLYLSFIQTAKENMAGSIDREETVHRLGDLASKLPYSNFKTSAILMHHLHRVASYHHVNQMTASNLGIVFGPTLLRPLEGTSSLASLVDTPHQTRAVELIISHVHEILGPDREYELIPGETPIEQLPVDAKAKTQPTSQPGATTKETSAKTSKPSPGAPPLHQPKEHILPPPSFSTESMNPPKASDAEFCLPGSAHTDKKDASSHPSPSISEGEDQEEDINSDEDLPENLLPDLSLPSQHVLHEREEEEGLHAHASSPSVKASLSNNDEISHQMSTDVHALTSQLNTDPDKGDHTLKNYPWYSRPIREEIQKVRYPQVTTYRAIPPHHLYLGEDTPSISNPKMLVPKITIIESSPITESKPQMCYPLKASDKHKTQNKALQNLKSLGPSLQNFVINTAKGLVGKASFPFSKDKNKDENEDVKEKKTKSSPPLMRQFSAEQLSFSALKQAAQKSPRLPRQSSIPEGVEMQSSEFEERAPNIDIEVSEKVRYSDQSQDRSSVAPDESHAKVLQHFRHSPVSEGGQGTGKSPDRESLSSIRKCSSSESVPSTGHKSLQKFKPAANDPPAGAVQKTPPPSPFYMKKGYYTPPPSCKFTHDAFMKLSESYPGPRSSQSPQLIRKSQVPTSSPSILRTNSSYPSLVEKKPYVPKFSPPITRQSRVSFSLPEDSLSESESSIDSSHTSTKSSFSLSSPWSSPTIARPTLKRQTPIVSPPGERPTGTFSFDQSLVKMRNSSKSSSNGENGYSKSEEKPEPPKTNKTVMKGNDHTADDSKCSKGLGGMSHPMISEAPEKEGCVAGIGAFSTKHDDTSVAAVLKSTMITSSSLLLSSLSPVLPRNTQHSKVSAPSSTTILSGNLPFRSPQASQEEVSKDCTEGQGEIPVVGRPLSLQNVNVDDRGMEESNVESEDDLQTQGKQIGEVDSEVNKEEHVEVSHKNSDPSIVENADSSTSQEPPATVLLDQNGQKCDTEISESIEVVDNEVDTSVLPVLHITEDSVPTESCNPTGSEAVAEDSSVLLKKVPSRDSTQVFPLDSPICTTVTETVSLEVSPVKTSPTTSALSASNPDKKAMGKGQSTPINTESTVTTNITSVDPSIMSVKVSSQLLKDTAKTVPGQPRTTTVTIPTQRTKTTTRTAVQTSKSSVAIDPSKVAKGPSGIVMGRSAINPQRSGQRGPTSVKKTTVQGKSDGPSGNETSKQTVLPSKGSSSSLQSSSNRKSSQTSMDSESGKKKSSVSATKTAQGSLGVACATCGRRKSAGRILDVPKPPSTGGRPRRGSADDLLSSSGSDQRGSAGSVGRGEEGKKYHSHCSGIRQPVVKPSVSAQRKDRKPRFV